MRVYRPSFARCTAGHTALPAHAPQAPGFSGLMGKLTERRAGIPAAKPVLDGCRGTTFSACAGWRGGKGRRAPASDAKYITVNLCAHRAGASSNFHGDAMPGADLRSGPAITCRRTRTLRAVATPGAHDAAHKSTRPENAAAGAILAFSADQTKSSLRGASSLLQTRTQKLTGHKAPVRTSCNAPTHMWLPGGKEMGRSKIRITLCKTKHQRAWAKPVADELHEPPEQTSKPCGNRSVQHSRIRPSDSHTQRRRVADLQKYSVRWAQRDMEHPPLVGGRARWALFCAMKSPPHPPPAPSHCAILLRNCLRHIPTPSLWEDVSAYTRCTKARGGGRRRALRG